MIVNANVVLGQQTQLVRGENLGRVEVELVPGETRRLRTDAFAAAWQPRSRRSSASSGFRCRAGAAAAGRGRGRQADGASLDVLKRASLELQDTLSGIPVSSASATISRSAKPR